MLSYAGLGMLLGAIGGLLGIGGGLLAIPVMGLVFGVDQQLAQGTALVMVVPNIMLALHRYHQHNPVRWRQSLTLAVPGFCCSILGALLAVALEARQMRGVFIGFLLLLSGYALFQAVVRPAAPRALEKLPGSTWLALLGALSGLLGGLFAVGSSVVATPALTTFWGLSQVVAQGLALALAVPSTCVALLTYALQGEVDWAMGIPLALGGLSTVGYGVHWAHRLPERVLRLAFSLFLLVSAALLLLRV